MAWGEDIGTFVTPVDLQMLVWVDYSGLDLRLGGFADTVFVTDDLQIGLIFDLVIDDIVLVTDVPSAEAVLTIDVVDAVAVTDELTFANIFNLSFDDAVTMTDAPVLAPGGLLDVADTVTTADATAFDVAPVFADFVGVDDDLIVGLAFDLQLADSVAMSDTLAKEVGITFADAVAVTDSPNIVGKSDPYFASVALLLHGDGPNNGVNTTFLDSGPNALTLTRNGSAAQGSFSPYASDGGSGQFNPTGTTTDWLQTAANVTNFGAGDFTIEAWVYKTTTGDVGIIGGTSWEVRCPADGSVVYYGFPNAALATAPAGSVPQSTWTHVAITRIGTALKVYINGVQRATGTETYNYPTAGIVSVGALRPGGTLPWTGRVSDARVVVGSAVYTAAFTPPTTPLTAVAGTALLCSFTNAAIIDSARKNDLITVGDIKLSNTKSKFGGSSIFYDGSGDGLFVASTPNFIFGASDFTIEAWINVTNAANGGGAMLYDGRSSSGSANNVTWYYANNQLVYYGNAAGRILSAVGAIQNNVWYHVAISRVAGNTRMFIDGVQVGVTWADATIYTAHSLTGIGECPWTTAPIAGFMEDVRVTKGIGRYVSNFTPPDAAFPDTGPTSGDPLAAFDVLLLHGDGANGAKNSTFLDSSPTAAAFTVTGAPVQGNFSPYAAAGASATFNGADALAMSAGSANVALGLGDFTIEAWVYPTPTSGTIAIAHTGTGAGGWQFLTTVSGMIGFYKAGGATGIETAAGVLPANQWSHLAVTRVGTTLTLWKNGVSIGTGVDASDYTVNVVTVAANSGLSQKFNGSIADFRMVKGTAVYTGAFTPPVAPLTAVAGTGLLLNFANGGVVDSARKKNLTLLGTTAIGTAQSKFGGSSISIPGGGSAVEIVSGNELAFGTGDFTIEFFVFFTTLAGVQSLYDSRGGATEVLIYMSAGGSITCQLAGASPVGFGGPLVVNTWNHLALSRTNGSIRLFVNGVQSGGAFNDSANNYRPNTVTRLGDTTPSLGSPFSGFLEEVRITKGVGRYTANFTPPVAPFPNP